MQKNQLLYDDNKSNYNKNNNTNNNRSDSYTTGPATSKNWGISHLTGLCGDNDGLNNGTSEWGTSITNNVSVNNTNSGTWGHTIPQQQQQQQSTTQGNNQNWANLNSGGGGGPSNQQQSQQGIINKNNNNNNNNSSNNNNNSSNNNNGTGGCLPSGNNQRQINNTNQTIDINIGVGNNVNNCNVGNNMNGKIIGNSSQQQQQSGGVVSGGGNIVSGGQSNQQQQQQQNNSQQQPPNGQSGLNGNNSGNNNSGNNHTSNGGNSGLVGGGTSAVAAKNQLEQLNTMREALFSQDGWGCQHVNQDTNWDVPGSPEPTSKSDPPGPSMWKPNINNGTELWEANLRNGGQPPPQPAQKTPWGPSTNLGGTWGEDDDGADASNVWTGTPANPSGPQWTQPVGGIWPPAGATAATQKKESEWGNSIATGNAWGDPRDLRAAPMDIRSVDPRDLRTPSADPREMRIIDPRESIRDMRGDPRGISGRLNGASEMWGQHHALTHGQIALNKMVGPTAAAVAAAAATGVNNAQWGSTQSVTGPKEIAMASKPTGWEEPSPPPQRRNIPNYDDGTSLWGPQSRVPLVSNWKDIPDMSRNNIIRGAIANQSGVGGAGAGTTTPMPPPRIGPNTQVKPDNNMWGHAAPGNRNNGTWDEQHTSANWDDKTTSIGNIGGAGWNDTTTSAAWSKNQNKIGSTAQVWPETDLGTEWGGAHAVNKSQPKLGGLTSETIRGSKPYRLLLDMGFKKEESEVTLRATNLNFDEAIELLNGRTNAPIDSWRRHDDPNVGFDHTSVYPGRFPGGPQPTMSFPPNNNPNIMNNVGGGGVGTNTGLAALNNMQPLQVTKYLSQAQQNVSNSQTVPGFGQVTTGNHNSGQPSAQQLRMLVQQIQMAVQGGYLSSQILNQPLAPTTLILLNQLLSIIKHLQGAQTSLSRNPINNLPLSVTITKYKQQISSLQNQINAQQALYVKQQQQATSHIGSSNTEYLRGHDAISALQGNFSEINLNKFKDQPGVFQGAPNQQSRLNQWKLPVLEKEASSDSTDFSRAPGPTAKPSLPTSTSNNIATLGLSNDGTWSSARNISDGWPDPNNENENKDWPAAQPSPATAFTDLVPEFEPGKPWKGSQIKTIEDDPSITPGSVARSPLSINPTPKDADIFVNSSKTSPTDLAPLSLSSSTWSFNPSGNQQNFTSWSDNAPQPSATTSELWTAPMNKSSRGPPPGLGANKASVSGAGSVAVTNPSAASGSTNGWMSSGLTGRVPSGNSNWSGANTGNWHSTWLLLKNLTTQIDGSTLRTLCMQHGPLQNFHLYLNQGIALCKYSTREEANKAQMALNNCVLGNTTICAESPNESEVQNILQHLPAVGQSQSGAGGSGGGSGGGGGGGGSSGGQSSWRPQSQNPSRPAEL